MTDQELHAHCEDWRRWCITRRYFIPPGAQNILARMQPSRSGTAPDAPMSEDMCFFNMAVHALADMRDPDTECFVKYYWHRIKNVKKVAAEMGVHRDTFYERKKRFARRALSMAESLKKAHNSMVEVDETAVIVD